MATETGTNPVITNIGVALSVLIGLLEQAASIGTLIKNAQASGADITPDQLTALVASYNSALAQLNADIAAAKSAGK